MTDIEQAFLRGMQKRAAELGIEKQAFAGNFVAGAARTILPHILTHKLTATALPALAKNPWLAKNFKRTSNLLNRTSNYVNNGTGVMNSVANLGLQFALHPIAQKPVDYLADKVDGQGY